MKRIIALLIATVMCMSSVAIFAAFDSTPGTYSYELKVLDGEGNVITKATPGSEVYVGLYLYTTEGKADLKITAAATFGAHFMYDAALTPGYDYATGDNTVDEDLYNDCEGATAAVLDMEDGTYIMILDGSIARNSTCTANTPIAKVKITLPNEEGDYSFVMLGGQYGYIQDTVSVKPVLDTDGATLTVAAKQEATPSISTAEPTATEAGIAVERADGTKFTYDNCYTVTVSMTNANDATKAGMQFIPKKVYENADNTWTGYAEVEFAADGLGAGERAYTAALINIPRKLAGQNIDMMARGFMVVDGEILTGTVVESVVNYKVTPEPGQN